MEKFMFIHIIYICTSFMLSENILYNVNNEYINKELVKNIKTLNQNKNYN